MKTIFTFCCFSFLLAGAISARAAEPAKFNGATPLEWSERMANSEMARLGNPPRARWDYTYALFAVSLLDLAAKTNHPAYADYATKLVGACVSADGAITGYKAADHSLDMVAPARVALALYARTGDARYQKAAQRVRAQLAEQPRTSDGGFWHKQIYRNQMWLDGLYMGGPFYAAYAKAFKEPADFDDVTKQILLADKHTYDAKTGLFYHGWEDTREQSWADKATGHSPSFWSRAIGWYAMAMVDILDDLPANHPARPAVLDVLRRLGEGVARFQDPTSGLWWQVTDQGGREGNYLEASGSSMFVYALAKGINQGYLPVEKYRPIVERGYAGLVRDLIKTDADGSVSLLQNCETAGLGNGRDGSYDYYVHKTTMVSNDLKGVGPFILAGLEMARLGAVTPAAASAGAAKTGGWDDMPAILARIKAPEFPAKDFPITNYGAVAGGETDSTDAIRQAIQACHAAGGGRVVVPDGVFLTGAIRLLSNVNLHLADKATLKFSTDPAKYLPVVFTRFESTECMNYSPFIYAWEQENIAITGKGTLDGSAGPTQWWDWTRQAGPDSRQNIAMSDRGVPPEQRIFGEGHHLRPNFIQPYRCKNFLIEDVTIQNSPMWEINPVLCTNVIVRGVNIMCPKGPNNDGCDPDSCRDVLIENCIFNTGDDCIAIKSGRNDDGRRVGVPSENIVVRNCTMQDGHGGVVIGSEITGGCRNVFAENCQMDSPRLNCILRFKNNAMRGGVIENIYLRNITAGRVAQAALLIEYTYQEGANGPYKPVLRNVTMSNIKGSNIPRIVRLNTFPAAVIENIRIENSVFTGPQPAEVQNTDAITFVNVTVEPIKSAAPATPPAP